VPVATIPFDSGQQQGVDAKLLPDGQFSLIVNGVLARDGQIRPRPAYTALGNGVYGEGGLIAYDLFSYNDRLCALADVATVALPTGRGFPTDLYELVEGGSEEWRASSPGAAHIRLPRATGMVDMGIPPDQEGGCISLSCAALGGFVCLVWNSGASGGPGYVHVIKASTRQTILLARLPSTGSGPVRELRVVALSDRFIVVGKNGDTPQDIAAVSFTPTVDETLQSIGNALITDGSGILNSHTVCAVAGSDQFVVAVELSTFAVRTRRFNAAGTLQVPSGGQYADIPATDLHAIEAHSASNTITVGTVDGSSNGELFTFNLTTGAEIGTGPHAPVGTDDVSQLTLVLVDATTLNVVCKIATVTTGTPEIRVRPYTPTTNAFGTVDSMFGCHLASSPIMHADEIVFAARHGGQEATRTTAGGNGLVSFKVGVASGVTPLCMKDLDISEVPGVMLPDIATDASTGKYYWANAVTSGDGDAQPRVTEFELGSSERRQTCQVGNHVLIGGAMPVVWDGHQLFEAGFLVRPKVVAITPDTVGIGTLLIGGATYFYVQIWEWLDALDNTWRSATSEPFEVELGAANDRNTIIGEAPISLRCNASIGEAGSAVRIKTYRTVASVTHVAATLRASNGTDPPSSSLVGLELTIAIEDSGGFNVFPLTLDGTCVDTDSLVTFVNANTSDMVATNDAGFLRLTADETGSGVTLTIYPGSANAVVGFTDYQSNEGTTDRVSGDVFHLAQTQYLPISSEMGAHITTVDTMSDDTLREQQILYTDIEPPLDHFAPLPADRVSSSGNRAAVAGQPMRERASVSKPFALAQGIQFADPGLQAFGIGVRGDIEAVIQREGSLLVVTRREIWNVTGPGPNRAGQREFNAPELVYGEGGLVPGGWATILSYTGGTLFQLDDNKIYSLTPGGTPEWIAHPVIDTLESYPVVKAVCHVKRTQSIVFACQNTDGDEGVLLRYDLRRKQWFQDDVGPVSALAEYQGRVALVLDGVVYLQDAESGNGTMPDLTCRLGAFKGGQAAQSGVLNEVVALLTYQDPCNVELQCDYGNGGGFVTCGDYDLADADYTAGQAIDLSFSLAVPEGTRYVLQLLVTSATANSSGAWPNALQLHWQKDEGPPHLSASRSR
jgi:hypothetical protein